jgi:signal transduction histidine kinase
MSQEGGGAGSAAAAHAVRAAAERIARLQASTTSLASARTPDEVADAALGAALATFDGRCALVLVPGADASRLEVFRVRGASECAVPEPSAASPYDDAWRSGTPVFVEDDATLRASYRTLGARAGAGALGALAALPLVVEDRALGVLGIGFDAGRPFTEDDRTFAAALATHCALALERARLFVAERLARAEAVAAQRRLAFLDVLSALLADTLDEEEMLAGVARLSVPALADWAGVLVAREGGALALAAAAGPAALGDATRALLDADPLARLAAVAHAGGPASIVDGPGGSGAPGPRCVAVVPLAVRGRTLGALALASADAVRRYGSADLALLSDVARRTAMAVEHARLFRETRLAVRAREEFLHVASHELRGPLGTLRLAVQLLGRDARGGHPEQTESRIRIVERQAERLVRLADALLDVSRITAGRLELHREETDLAAIAREVAARHAEEAADARCALSVDAPVPVRGVLDVARLEQVATNLLTNALKYGRGTPVEVRVREERGRGVLEVSDRGIGVAPEDQARVFERFERAVSSRHYAGLGLGLWIVRRILEAHGGAIRLRSAPGQGATFTVELPLSAG